MTGEDDVVYVRRGGGTRVYHEDPDCLRLGREPVPRRREIGEAWYPPCDWCATDEPAWAPND